MTTPISPSQYDHGDDTSQDKMEYEENLEEQRDEGIAVNELTASKGWEVVKTNVMKHVNDLQETIFDAEDEKEALACIHKRKGILLVIELIDEFIQDGESAALKLNSSNT